MHYFTSCILAVMMDACITQVLGLKVWLIQYILRVNNNKTIMQLSLPRVPSYAWWVRNDGNTVRNLPVPGSWSSTAVLACQGLPVHLHVRDHEVITAFLVEISDRFMPLGQLAETAGVGHQAGKQHTSQSQLERRSIASTIPGDAGNT